MTAQAVRPGQLLAGRYRVEDLLDEVGGVRSWRAVDEVLSRAVFIHTLPTDDARAAAVTDAARSTSQLHDTRFLQVFDVDAEGDTVYVVREWIIGQNLKVLLADGSLTAEQAVTLGREVAEALANAHRQGLTHLRLEPSSVVIARNGAVKISGLAVEAALHGSDEGDPGELDAAGVGRILYAALTGRWPGEESHGLPVAPRIDGRFASPRQVRPGVPRLLDEVVDRTLGNAERHHAPPLRSPAEVAEALGANTTTSTWGNGVLSSDSGEDPWPPPAVLDEPVVMDSPGAAHSPEANSRPSAQSRTVARVVGVLVGTAFLLGAAWLGWNLLLSGFSSEDDAAEPSPEPGETIDDPQQTDQPADVEPTPVALVDAVEFDPEGGGSEHPELTPNAIDDESSTAWRTLNYFDPMELQKAGVGLYVDLGDSQPVQAVNLTILDDDSDLEVRIAPEGDSAPDDVDDWTVVGAAESAGEAVEITLDSPMQTQYVLVWFTRLPQVGEDYSGGIADVEVLG